MDNKKSVSILENINRLHEISVISDFDKLKEEVEKFIINYSSQIGIGRVDLIFCESGELSFKKNIYDSDKYNNDKDNAMMIPSNPENNSFAFLFYPITYFDEKQELSVMLIAEHIHRVIRKGRTIHNLDDYENISAEVSPLKKLGDALSISRCISMLQEMGEINKYTLLYFNIKNFAAINNACGNIENGNKVLDAYVTAIKDKLDINEHLARNGGDNFVILALNENVDNLIKFLNSVPVTAEIDKLQLSFDLECTGSIYKLNNDDLSYKPVDYAKQTLKLAKKDKLLGFTNYERYKQKIETSELIKNDFDSALAEKRILLYYQPKVNPYTNELCGSEVLCRWQTKDGKIVSPGAFIPILEEEKLIFDLDFYMLRETCKDIKDNLKNGIEPVPVSVNFSRYHFINSNRKYSNIRVDFIDRIISIINEYKIDPKYIQIEITEAGKFEEDQSFKEYIDCFHNAKLKVLMDDYGTGYNNFKPFISTNFDIAKLDKSLISDIYGSDSAKAERERIILEYQVKMLQNLDVKVLCEGVEDKEQVDFLKSIGCDYIQGYFYSKPLPKIEYQKRLINKKFGD